MPDPDAKRTTKVSQSAIDEIRKLGMSKAISKYTRGEGSPEFKTAVERYYSPQRLKAASKTATKEAASKPKPKPKTETPKAPVTMPKSAPAAAGRKTKPKGSSVLGERNAKAVGNAGASVGRVLSNLSSGSKGITGQGGDILGNLGKKFGVRNPFKPRKRK